MMFNDYRKTKKDTQRSVSVGVYSKRNKKLLNTSNVMVKLND